MKNENVFVALTTNYFEQNMASASRSLESMSESHAAEVLQSLPTKLVVRILKNLQISYVATLIALTKDPFLKSIANQLDPQFLSSVLMHLSDKSRDRLRKYISGKTEDKLREYLEYPEGSVGRFMTVDFLAFNKTIEAREAIGKIRALSKKRMPSSYVYVVDDDFRLVGVLNMRDLMLASPQQSLESIVQKDIFSIHCFVDLQEAANELAKRKYFAAPVVDSENHILGIIKAERLIKGVQEGTTQDIQRMFGVSADERPFSTILFSLKKRLFWLHINLVTAFMAAAVVAVFEGIIAKITVLAVFLPVVAGQGGNAGAQSLAVVMRGIVMREIPKGKKAALIVKEGKLGAVNGTIIGFVTAVIAWLWIGNPYLGLVIGLGMLVNLICAGLSGAAIPLIMKKMGIDPAQSANIILTTVTDIIGFFAFLGFAVLFQNFLIG